MSGGGGKGDKTTQTVRLPKEVEDLAKRNLGQAERASQIGYVPYQGPTIAALNPAARANMGNNQAMAGAFGLQTADPGDALPAAQTYAGGLQGYDPMALYMQALSRIPEGQRRAIESFSMNPQTGAPATAALRATAAAPAKKAPMVWDWKLNGGAGGYKPVYSRSINRR